jgi:hypothetical protein
MKNKIQNALTLLAIASLGIVVIFFTFPSLLITLNWEDLADPLIYFRTSLYMALVVTFVLFALFAMLPQKIAHKIALIIAAYGLVAYIFDLAFPLNIGPVETGSEKVVQSIFPGILQIIVFFSLIYGFLKLPSKLLKTLIPTFAGVLFVFSLLPLLPSQRKDEFNEAAFKNKKNAVEETAGITPAASGLKFNIYHFIFDAYQGAWLEWSLSELNLGKDLLSGFTKYNGVKTNYPDTVSSFTSFMSGTHYDSNISFRDWFEKTNNSSIISDLNTIGFNTTIYTPLKRAGFEGAKEIKFGSSVPAALVADYWLLRSSPVILRKYVLTNGAGPFSRMGKKDILGDLRAYNSYRQYQSFLKEEKDRPETGQYVLVYTQIPHAPYQMNRNGKFVGKSSYKEQLHLATNMIRDTVEKLKELNRFDNSIIIIHSDHGVGYADEFYGTGDKLRDFIKIDKETSDKIKKIDVRNMNGITLEARFSPLLLVKQRGTCAVKSNELEVQSYLSQLLDIRNFINTNTKDVVKKCEFPKSKSVDMIHGLVTQKKDGKRVTVGKNLTEGRINHYTYTDEKGFQAAPDKTFKY